MLTVCSLLACGLGGVPRVLWPEGGEKEGVLGWGELRDEDDGKPAMWLLVE